MHPVVYHRHWHHFPSDRFEEQIVRLSSDGKQVSISKATHLDGRTEYHLVTGDTSAPPLDSFATTNFGSSICSEDQFEALRSELLIVLGMGYERAFQQ
jgi:hypothetical protein